MKYIIGLFILIIIFVSCNSNHKRIQNYYDGYDPYISFNELKIPEVVLLSFSNYISNEIYNITLVLNNISRMGTI